MPTRPELEGQTSHPDRWRLMRRYGPILLIAVVVAVLIASGVTRYLSLDELGRRRHGLEAYVSAHPTRSVLIYAGVYVAVVGLSLPGALVMTLSGGFLFGLWLGTAAAVAGASTGAIVMFLVARSALGDGFRRRAKPGGFISRLEGQAQRHAFSYLITLRLIPALPFALVNIAAGVVKMPLGAYVAGTVLGVIPSTLVYAGVGAGLGALFDRGGRPGVGMLLTPQVLIPLAAMAALSLAPHIYRAWRARREQARQG